MHYSAPATQCKNGRPLCFLLIYLLLVIMLTAAPSAAALSLPISHSLPFHFPCPLCILSSSLSLIPQGVAISQCPIQRLYMPGDRTEVLCGCRNISCKEPHCVRSFYEVYFSLASSSSWLHSAKKMKCSRKQLIFMYFPELAPFDIRGRFTHNNSR